MSEGIKKHIPAAIVLSIAAYIAVFIFSGGVPSIDYAAFLNPFAIFSMLIVAALITIIKIFRWQYYLKLLGFSVKFKDAGVIFMIGMVWAFTPGKVGDFHRCWLLKKQFGYNISKTSPSVFAEKLTELLALALVVAITAVIVKTGSLVSVIVTSIIFLILIMFLSRKAISVFSRFLAKFRFTEKYSTTVKEILLENKKLIQGRSLVEMTLLGLLIWALEILLFILIINISDENISVIKSSFVYSVSVLTGSVSFLPGGTGVTEGSLSVLLMKEGFAAGNSVAVTFLIRFFTLWTGIIAGSGVWIKKKSNFI